MDDFQVVLLRRLYEMYGREHHPTNMYNAAISLRIDKSLLPGIVEPLSKDGHVKDEGQNRYTLTEKGIEKLKELDWSPEQTEQWILGKLYDKYLQDSTLIVRFRQPRFDKQTPYFRSQDDPPWTTFFREIKHLMYEGLVEVEVVGNRDPFFVGVDARLTSKGYDAKLKERKQLQNKTPTTSTRRAPVLVQRKVEFGLEWPM